MANNKNSEMRALFALSALVASFSVSAQEPESNEAGGLTASVGIHADFDDNLFDSNADEIDSWIGRISPDILLSTTPGRQQFSLHYVGDYGKFFDSEDDNYADHSLTGRAEFQTGSRGLLDFSAAFRQGHEGRGSQLSQGIQPDEPEFPTEPDEFDEVNWSAGYTHGSEGARGRLSFGVGGIERDYTSNRDRTRFFDREETFGFVGLSIGAQERLAYVLEARYTEIDYPFDRPGETSISGDSVRGLVGVTWEASTRTRGSILVGAQRRSFDEPTREENDSLSWDVEIRWAPREYSYFDITTSREDEETIGNEDYIDRTTYGIAWTHEWPNRFESELRWDRRDDDFIGTARRQEDNEIYFGLRFPQGERLTWDAGVTHQSRDSTIDAFEFDGLLYTLGVDIVLAR